MEKEVKKGSVTIVLFSGTMDKAIAAFIVSCAAASMGMRVSIFFTFWGLNVIKRKGGIIRGRRWTEKMLNVMNYGHAKKLAISNMNMMGMGPAMLKKMMSDRKMPGLDELIKTALVLGVKFYPCEMSMTMMGLGKEDFIDGCEDVIGAVSYLAKARDSEVNLFI